MSRYTEKGRHEHTKNVLKSRGEWVDHSKPHPQPEGLKRWHEEDRHRRISDRAYFIWLAAGRPDWLAEKHWQIAEAEYERDRRHHSGAKP